MARRSTAPSLWLPGFDPDEPEVQVLPEPARVQACANLAAFVAASPPPESTLNEADHPAEAIEPEPERPFIDPEGFHDAKSVAPGYDVYGLYDEWVSWWNDSGRPELKSPRAAFVGFCRNRHKRSPLR